VFHCSVTGLALHPRFRQKNVQKIAVVESTDLCEADSESEEEESEGKLLKLASYGIWLTSMLNAGGIYFLLLR
jgi:hypothetical protein